ncbi:MAG TPA: tRNA (adenosine(37)-N6)-dimethylallyltransferase MiaA [Chitinophagales bacterium]|nr:tRNA (adenosine(37)-N6)-dimethylallyltransferase MiaA [Chitinophagales bacterium]HRP38718.1 tRNA (adenosine(37)-N6)-dimethylallyltransferase MiaA [Chitinophagales bacterium]
MKPTLIVVCGPTAVGKTSLSIELAKLFGAEIISADSRQFYREMNIGTAKPSEEELGEVLHHFINNISIFTKHYSAGKFEYEVLQFLEKYYLHKSVAVMVGGSGLFINAVCSGFDKIETKDESELWATRKFLNTQTLEWLQNEVERLDAEYFEIVDKKNPIRLKRALEIIYSTGKKYSEQRIGKKAERPFHIIKIGLTLPRELLYEKINQRVDVMMQQGLLNEAKALFINKKLPALNTVGYTELFDFIEDKLSLDEAVALIKQNTRNYAKRQMTWFKKDENIKWFQPNEKAEIVSYIESKLNTP